MTDDRRFPFGAEQPAPQAAPFEPVRDTLPLVPGPGAAPRARPVSTTPPPVSGPTPPPLVSAALPSALPERLPAPRPEASPWSGPDAGPPTLRHPREAAATAGRPASRPRPPVAPDSDSGDRIRAPRPADGDGESTEARS
jgi:hypothetical protein